MAGNWGSADFKELKKLQDKLHKLQSTDVEIFCRECSKELAARLLALVIKRTPVGKYPKDSGKKGGTLRRGWTGGKKMSASAFANDCKVYKNGNIYTIVVKNNVEYASYVEFGHRKRGKTDQPAWGWVDGKFYLTLSEEDLESIAPSVLEKKLEKFLRRVFDV